MKPVSIAVFIAAVSAAGADWNVDAEAVTQIVQRIHYTCPCNGKETIVTSTVPSSRVAIGTSISWTEDETTSTSSVWSTTTASFSTDDTISTTTTPITTPSSTTSISSSTTPTTTTTTSVAPVVTPGQPFLVKPQLAAPDKLRKRATSYVGFSGSSAVLVSDASSAWTFTITTDNALVAGPDSAWVGTSSLTQSSVLSLWTAEQPAQQKTWSATNGVLTYPGASFCLSSDNYVVMYYTDAPSGCQLLQFTVDPDTTLSASPSTSTTTTSSTTTPSPLSSTSSTLSTTSSISAPTPPSQNTTCLASVPSNSCFSYVSTNSTSPQYRSKCDYKWTSPSWGGQRTFTQCMAQCDVTSASVSNSTSACIGFMYNAGTTVCGSTGQSNCWFITKEKAPVVTVGANEDLLTDVWSVNLLQAYYS